jgi:O-antigen/teichoic acid export membrane protein
MNLSKFRLHPSEIFSNEFQNQELKNTVVQGSMALVLSQGVSFGLSMANTMILARLLVPADFGVIGMVTVFINFLAMFKDAGLSMATIQNDNINSKQISTLFWINGLISLTFGAMILISAPLVSMFYKRPELTAVTAVLSLSFIMQGFCIQHSALLQRHLKFTALAVNDIVAQVVSLVVAAVMAYFGFRYWALVCSAIARAVTLTTLTFYCCPWVPGKMEKGSGVRNMLKFGGNLTASNFVGYLSRNLDGILIGRFIGAGALGIYSRAFTLLMSPLTQIRGPLTTLSLPVLSSLKSEPARFRSFFQKLLDVSISLALPISVYCYLESEFLIRILLGAKWMSAVPVFKIFAVAGIFIATSGAPGVVMLSHGLSKRYLHLTLLTAGITCLSYVVGVFFGISGMAIAYTISSFLIMIPLITFGFRGTPITMRDVLGSMIGPIFAAGMAGAGTYFFMRLMPGDTFIKHALVGIVYFVIYVILTMARPKTRETVRSIWESVLARQKSRKLENSVEPE